MAIKQGISGIDEVLKRLNKEIQGIVGRSEAGLIKAMIPVMVQSKIETPVDTSNLIGSQYGPNTRADAIEQTSKGPVVEIGFTGAYAPFVHEMVGANFTGPRPTAISKARQVGGKPTTKAKFLEDPLKANERQIINTIKAEAKIE